MFKRIREIITKFSKIIFHTSNIKKIKEAHQETPIFRYIELWQYARNIGAPIPVREIGVAGCNQAEKLINHTCSRIKTRIAQMVRDAIAFFSLIHGFFH